MICTMLLMLLMRGRARTENEDRAWRVARERPAMAGRLARQRAVGGWEMSLAGWEASDNWLWIMI